MSDIDTPPMWKRATDLENKHEKEAIFLHIESEAFVEYDSGVVKVFRGGLESPRTVEKAKIENDMASEVEKILEKLNDDWF